MAKQVKNFKKRYIVTYAAEEGQGPISVEAAAAILEVAPQQLQDGVAVMATDAEPNEADILHFENLGVSTLVLSEAEAERLRSKSEIVSVEEDHEMHILQSTTESTLALVSESSEDSYQRGRKEMYLELLQAFFGEEAGLYVDGNGTNGDESALFTKISQQAPPIVFPPVQPIPWNIKMVKAPTAWSRGLRGEGIKVAVLDTGIAAHIDLLVAGGASFVPGVVSYHDDNGHGTHCAGIIGARNNFYGVVGVAPRCSLYAVKVLNENGSGTVSGVIAGLEWALANKMDVVSMSLGGGIMPQIAYTNAILRLQNAGIAVVCAAGNSFGGGFPWVNAPANSIRLIALPGYPSIRLFNASPIAVGAIDSGKSIAPFSSRGGQPGIPWNQVMLVAPGVSINSTFPVNNYRPLSGTSMATPHVAGAVALIKQKFLGITVQQIKAKLMSTAADLGFPGNDETYGAGLLNCDLATL